jgi:hypothetical protein
VNRSNQSITTFTADLAVGVPFKPVGTASGAGAVIVLYGSVVVNGLTVSGVQLWTQNSPGMPCCSESGDHFGGGCQAASRAFEQFKHNGMPPYQMTAGAKQSTHVYMGASFHTRF